MKSVFLLPTLMLALAACADGEASLSAATAAPETAPTAQRGRARTANTEEINPRLLRRFQPVVGQGGSAAVSKEKVALGRMLYFDKRLSRGHDLSCNSCHDLAAHGADGRRTSVGHKGQVGTRNAPTVYNAASHIAQFWDGRAETVEKQATGPILNPIEMANSEDRVVETLSSIPRYVEMFRAAYPGDEHPVSLAHVGDAIGAFERGLTTSSRWDEFIAGKTDALTQTEKRGLRIFLDVGCMACHTGPQVGASMYQRVGVIEPWPNQSDIGRAAITKVEGDKMTFKVPSLKNIADTGPYFHDGSAATLEDAIRTMARHQVGVELTDEDVASIAAWMRSLSGTIDPAYIAAPELPPTTDRTPQPVLY
jgi:cytochrome c peroxidase